LNTIRVCLETIRRACVQSVLEEESRLTHGLNV